MSDPRQLDVKGKKPVVAERTLAERKYCAIDQFYYSEMFTCPICYGVERERERIIAIIREAQREAMSKNGGYTKEVAEAFGQEWPLVKGWKDKLINLIKGEHK